MNRFGIHTFDDGLVMVLQYPGLDTGRTVLAAPLYRAGAAMPMEVITPSVEFGGETYLLGTHLLAAIPKTALGPLVGNTEPQSYEVSRALDRLFFGN